MNKARVAIFASGNGSNAENIITYFMGNPKIEVRCIFTNNPQAYVIDRAEKFNVPSFVFTRPDLYTNGRVIKCLQEHEIDYIVLAGFLWLMPSSLISQFEKKIINIHPALLPEFGGEGMYGKRVHEAVVASGVQHSGITIHLVNDEYDKGKILFQAYCEVSYGETPATLAEKIHSLEFKFFPKVLEEYIEESRTAEAS